MARRKRKKKPPISGGRLPTDFDQSYLDDALLPLEDNECWAWDYSSVRTARDGQRRGDFRLSAPLADAVTTDPTIFGSLLNRCAPGMAIETEVTGPKNRKRLVTAAATEIHISPGLVCDIVSSLAQLGVFVGQNHWIRRKDGSRIDVELRPWPMATVWWDKHERSLMTMTEDGQIVRIRHGDGKWVVMALRAHKPWKAGAVKAIGVHWAHRLMHVRDRGRSSEAHGEAKFMAYLPEKVALDSKAGKALAKLVKEMRNKRSGGIAPHGAKVELLEAVSQMWQIFDQAIKSIDTDIARTYLGQDGTLTNEGGNYIKAAQLFGVRHDIVQGDLIAAAAGINTGTIRPWSAVNFGVIDQHPQMSWLIPDPDELARKQAADEEGARYAARYAAFLDAISQSRELKLAVNLEEMAERFRVDPPKEMVA